MSISIYRKGKSVKSSSLPMDESAIDIDVHEINRSVFISFTTGSSGGQTNFMVGIDGNDLAAMAYHCHKALVSGKAKNITDYTKDEILEALTHKLKED